MNRLIAIFSCLAIVINSYSQEFLNDLSVNRNLYGLEKNTSRLQSSKDILTLPIFDDFSYDSVFPTTKIWVNHGVYVNTHYGIGTPSIGVATFDGVDDNGKVYEHLSTSPQVADSLTTLAIDLSGYNQESVFITFYYQPQGYGNAPEFNDSLVLRLFSSLVDTTIWFANGTDFESFKNDTLGFDQNNYSLDFKLVHLKLNNPLFFEEPIKVQFKNYVSIHYDATRRTNSDHWNIDYFNIRNGVTEADTVFYDVAMTLPFDFFMRKYSSVPWSHYDDVIENELHGVDCYIRNNYSESVEIKEIKLRTFNVETQELITIYTAGSQSSTNVIPPFSTTNSIGWGMSTTAPVSYDGKKKAKFKMQANYQLDNENDIDRIENNFAYRYVEFDNYYAYDDGSAEAAYGVDINGAQVAYLFRTYKEDTLLAVNFHFEETQDPLNTVFKLCVWAYDDGKPGTLLRYQEDIEFIDLKNGFVRIDLHDQIVLDGEFFIGWEQTSDTYLNIGFDYNNKNISQELYYFAYNTWNASELISKGSLMMRPVFGDISTSIENNNKAQNSFSIYPNPTNGKISIENINDEYHSGTVEVFNLLGKLVCVSRIEDNTIDLSTQDNGVYIVRISPENQKPENSRLILTK
ncbi:MAG: T9SS type A sorting domain-containing protein [Salinivirgaceae bacterium]|nr:T9SS type A sorting domain-containing protein [Salinivirgaceae bacterium]